MKTTALLVLMLVYASIADARSWNGINPGTSKRSDVIAKLGNPTREIQKPTGNGIVYMDKKQVEGTQQVQILFRQTPDVVEVVDVVYVFPKPKITKQQIIQTYGSSYTEKLTDSFKTYFFYKEEGLVVYFGRGGDNNVVTSLTFQEPVAKPQPNSSESTTSKMNESAPKN